MFNLFRVEDKAVFTLPVIGSGKKTRHPYPRTCLQLLYRRLEFFTTGNDSDVADYLALHASFTLLRLMLQGEVSDGYAGRAVARVGGITDDSGYLQPVIHH